MLEYKSDYIGININHNIKKEFKSICRRYGLNMSDVIEQYIIKYINDNSDKSIKEFENILDIKNQIDTLICKICISFVGINNTNYQKPMYNKALKSLKKLAEAEMKYICIEIRDKINILDFCWPASFDFIFLLSGEKTQDDIEDESYINNIILEYEKKEDWSLPVTGALSENKFIQYFQKYQIFQINPKLYERKILKLKNSFKEIYPYLPVFWKE